MATIGGISSASLSRSLVPLSRCQSRYFSWCSREPTPRRPSRCRNRRCLRRIGTCTAFIRTRLGKMNLNNATYLSPVPGFTWTSRVTFTAISNPFFLICKSYNIAGLLCFDRQGEKVGVYLAILLYDVRLLFVMEIQPRNRLKKE